MKKKIADRLKKLKPMHYLLIFLGVVIYAGIIIGIVNYRSNRVINPPRLDIISPIEGDTYSSESLIVNGKTEPRAKVTVAGQEVKANKDGEYTATIPLQLGQNTLTFSVTKNKLKTEKVINVSRIEPEVAKQPSVVVNGNEKLNNSGPETFWLLETGLLAASGAAYQTSKRKLRLARKD